MKRVIVLLMLMMTGCGYGYHVTTKNVFPCNNQSIAHDIEGGKCAMQLAWVCRLTTPLFFNDLDKAVCQTKEECSKVCLELSK